MTDQLIAPVIPSSARRLAGDGSGRSGRGRPLPLASPPDMPLDAVYGMSRIDASGRVADRLIIDILNWQPGDRLTLTAGAGVALARRDSCGLVTVSAWRCMAVPAALRHWCGLRAGDRVLLAALPGEDALAVYTLAVVDRALRAHATFLRREGGRS